MRVYIRKPEKSDASEYLQNTKDSIALHRPWVYPATSLEGYHEYLERIKCDRQEGFLICRKRDDAMVGLVNLNEIVRGCLQSAFVGYWGIEQGKGKGYMSEGVALAIDHAFDNLGLHRLEISIQPTNTASLALADRLGLVREGFSDKYLKIGGEWKDHERYAIIADDWQARGGSRWVVANRLSQA